MSKFVKLGAIFLSVCILTLALSFASITGVVGGGEGSASSTDTLQDVTLRGNTTTTSINASGYYGNFFCFNETNCLNTTSGGGGSATPAGNDGEIQINVGGSFGTQPYFYLDDSSFGSFSAAKAGEANGLASLALGYSANATGTLTHAIGYRAKSTGFASLALLGGVSIGSDSIAIGSNAQTLGVDDVAIGDSSIAKAGTIPSFSIGKQAQAYGGSLKIGAGTADEQSIALTTSTSGYANLSSVAIGAGAGVRAEDNGVAIGKSVQSRAFGAIAIGDNILNDGQSATAIGRYLQPTSTHASVIGTGSFGNYVTNSIQNSLLIGFRLTSNQQNILHAENNKGVRIGETSGESITMDGDDLYVAGNQETDGFLVLGSNTETGLSAGDINASTIYYDTLVAKSPTFLCESETNWCQITVPQYQKSLYVDFTKDWQVQNVQFDGVDYTPSQFINNVCPKNAKTQAVCDEIITKYQKLKAKYDYNLAYDTFVSDCEDAGNTVILNECVRTETNSVTYSTAVRSYQEAVYNYTTVIEYELDETLKVISHETLQKDSITGYRTKYKFYNGCGWDDVQGYYCSLTTVTEVFS
jgi:hypothetical protein